MNYHLDMRRCIIVFLSLQLSSLLCPEVSGLQCYRCNSIETPSCKDAGNTNEWETCQDDVCLTGIGSANILGGLQTVVVARDCNRSIPVETGAHLPVVVTDRCVHGMFNYVYNPQIGLNLRVNATICPCFTSLCNSGSITLGGTAATGPPPTTTTTTTTTATDTTRRTTTITLPTKDRIQLAEFSSVRSDELVTTKHDGPSTGDSSTSSSEHVLSTITSSAMTNMPNFSCIVEILLTVIICGYWKRTINEL